MARTIKLKGNRTYKIICVSMYPGDLAELDAKVEHLKQGGWRTMSRSLLIRMALAAIDVTKLQRPPTVRELVAALAAEARGETDSATVPIAAPSRGRHRRPSPTGIRTLDEQPISAPDLVHSSEPTTPTT